MMGTSGRGGSGSTSRTRGASTAIATMYDHHFTGDALADFGLRPEDLIMSGVREDLDDDDISSTRSSSTQSTVLVSNLHPTSPTTVSGGCTNKKFKSSPSTTLSLADGTILSSLDKDNDEDSAVSETLRGILLPRIMLCVSLSLICMSIIGVVMVWNIFSTEDTNRSMGYSENDGIEPLGGPGFPSVSPLTPPSGSGGGRNNNRDDLFSDSVTDKGRLECPSPSQPTPPLPGKKGMILDMDNTDLQLLQQISSLKPHWSYSSNNSQQEKQQQQQRLESLSQVMEYVPLVSIGGTNSNNDVGLLLSSVMPQHKRVMGFYEPDAPGRWAVSVDDAVDQWHFMEDLNLPIISPSTINPTGTWMKEFMDRVDEKCLRIDWIGIHWFGEPSFSKFKTDLQEIYNMYGRRPLLLTEFAIADWSTEQRGFNQYTASDVLQFMRQALPWLEKQNWIAGYAWCEFDIDHPAGGPSALFDENGLLTSVGTYYSSVTKDDPVGEQ